jgi:hypothetical protein
LPNGGKRGVGADARLATSACLVRAAAPGRSARVSLRSRTTQTRPLAVLIQRVTCGTGKPELRRDPRRYVLWFVSGAVNSHTDHAVVRRAAGALPAPLRRPQRCPRPAVHLELLARQKETIQSGVIATTVRIPKRDRRLHCGREDYTGVQSDRFRYVNALFSPCSERHGPRATRGGARRPPELETVTHPGAAPGRESLDSLHRMFAPALARKLVAPGWDTEFGVVLAHVADLPAAARHAVAQVVRSVLAEGGLDPTAVTTAVALLEEIEGFTGTTGPQSATQCAEVARHRAAELRGEAHALRAQAAAQHGRSQRMSGHVAARVLARASRA